MSLSSLINGADCGPSNALQTLTKRIDADRGARQDHFGIGRAGPSRPTFRTQAAHNVELHTEKSEFFNHASMLARPTDLVTSSFDLSGLGRALTNQEMHTHPKFSQFNAINAPSVPQKSDWAAAFLQEQQKPSIQDHPRENFQLSGMNETQFSSPPLFTYMPQQPIFNPGVLIPGRAVPITSSASWDQEFIEQARSLDDNLGKTAENPVPVERDELARTAGLLVESLKDESNPKFQNSVFLTFMRQLRDKEMVVEGDEIVPSSEVSMSTAETSTRIMSEGSRSRGLQQNVGVLSGMTHGSSKSVHFSPVLESAGDLEVSSDINEEDAFWDVENRDFREYWERAATVEPGSSIFPQTRGVFDDLQQKREWDHLQDSWDSWEATATGVKPTVARNYAFQTNNPYVFDSRHASADWKVQGGHDQTLLEREAAVLEHPQDAESWYQLGVKQQANEREDKAIQALQKAVELDPSMLPAWVELSVSYSNDGNRSGACLAIEEWINRNAAYSNIVETWKRNNTMTSPLRVKDLIECLIVMARSSRGNVDADVQVALGVLLNTTEEYAKAKDCFLAALDVRPDDYLLYNRVGATAANNGQPEEALKYYDQALILNPTYIRARFNLGISCISLQRHEEAAHHILDALVLQESDGIQTGEGRGVTSSILWDTLRNACLHLHRQDLARICDRRDLNRFRAAFLVD